MGVQTCVRLLVAVSTVASLSPKACPRRLWHGTWTRSALRAAEPSEEAAKAAWLAKNAAEQPSWISRASEDDQTPEEGRWLSTQFSTFIAGEAAASKVSGFNEDLYAHLNQRPEYETSQMYKKLRERVDVTDPLYSELEQVTGNDRRVGPTSETTPGEAIETVLRALRNVDEPRPNWGLELLQRFSSSASALGQSTTEQLRDYFDTSKYGIVFSWVDLRYTRKLDLSIDKRRAVQQLVLIGRDGTTVPVTFRMASYASDGGEDVWLIDQLLVKSVDM